MSDDTRGLRYWFGWMTDFVELTTPHLTWIVGALLVIEAFYPRGFYRGLGEYPEATLFVIGIFVFLSGRKAVSARKEYRREKRRAERYEQAYQQMKEAYLDQL